MAELLVSIRRDDQFGLAMTLASGGTLTELLQDATTLVLPASNFEITSHLGKLKVSGLLNGYRGGRPVDIEMLVANLQRLAAMVSHQPSIAEVEINPLFVSADGVCLVDAMVAMSK